MSLRHFKRLAILVKYNPRILRMVEKELRLREKYGPWVTLTFWECLRHLEEYGGEPFFKHCLETNLASLSADVTQKEFVSRFLKDLKEIQEQVRDFLTRTFWREAEIERLEGEFSKVVKEERGKIRKVLEEVF